MENRLLHLGPSIGGAVRLPASKSITNRILAISALAHTRAKISNVASCDDAGAMERVVGRLEEGGTIDIGAAGTAMRFATALLSVASGEYLLTGSERMRHRPIKPLVDALRSIGADIEYVGAEGFPPLHIKGRRLQGGTVEIDAGVSSQYISALLMVAPQLERGMLLTLRGKVVSRPYIDLTIGLMKQFGAEVGWTGAQTIEVKPRPYDRTEPFVIENDWSAASYWYELIAISPDETAKIELLGLWPDSLQGDRRVEQLFRPLGVKTQWSDDGIVLTKSPAARLVPYEADLTEQPDLAQTLVVTCCMLERPFRLAGLQSLRLKETDRIAALQNELRKLGYVVSNHGDTIMEWSGEKCAAEANPSIHTYDDHRMAMAFAPAAMKTGDLVICNPQVVSKSYPEFWNDLLRCNF